MDRFIVKQQLFIFPVNNEQSRIWDEPGYFYLLWLERGNTDAYINMRHFVLDSDKRLILVPPDSTLTVECSSNGLVFCIGFSIEFLQVEGKEYAADLFKLFVSYDENPYMQIEVGEVRQLKILSLMMNKEFLLDRPSVKILQGYLRIILLTLIRSNKRTLTLPDKSIERLHDFLMLVYKHARGEKRVSFYASQLNLSAKRLNQVLHIFFPKRSASSIIQEHLVMDAKRMIISGKYSVKEVAYLLGFEDRAYFSRFFKKWTGIAPDNFRVKYLSKLDNYR